MSIAFSSDDNYILSGSIDDTIKLWDRRTGKELLTLKGHLRSVMSVAFSSDDRFILSGSKDNTIKLWDR